MSFNDNVTLDTSQVRSGGGGGAPGRHGRGGRHRRHHHAHPRADLRHQPRGRHRRRHDRPTQDQVQAGGDQSSEAFAECKTGADANENTECRVIGTVNSVQAFWSGELPRFGKEWQDTKTVLYSGATQSACGTASNQVGPVLLPARQVGLHRRRLLPDPRAAVRQQRGAAGPGVRRRPRVRPRPPGPARAPGPGAAGPAGSRVGCGAHRAHGRLPRRGVGPPRDDGEGRGHRRSRSSSRSPSRTSRTPCPRPPPSATTPSRRRRRAGSRPRTGRTARRRPVSAGSSRASRPATSTSATPSPWSPSTEASVAAGAGSAAGSAGIHRVVGDGERLRHHGGATGGQAADLEAPRPRAGEGVPGDAPARPGRTR